VIPVAQAPQNIRLTTLFADAKLRAVFEVAAGQDPEPVGQDGERLALDSAARAVPAPAKPATFDDLGSPLCDLSRMAEIADRLAIDLGDAKVGSDEHARTAELLVLMVWSISPMIDSIVELYNAATEGAAG
jgi:hypothetical protein